MCKLYKSVEFLAPVWKSEVYNANSSPLMKGLVLVRSKPLAGIHASSTASQPLHKRAFSCVEFRLTRHGEKRPAAMRHTPPMLKAVEGKCQAAPESVRQYRDTRQHASWNDAELSYCVNAQLPDEATAPKVMRVESPNWFIPVGVFLPKFTTHQRLFK